MRRQRQVVVAKSAEKVLVIASNKSFSSEASVIDVINAPNAKTTHIICGMHFLFMVLAHRSVYLTSLDPHKKSPRQVILH